MTRLWWDRRRLRPYLLLSFLWLAYFHPLVLHPTQTLFAPDSDLLAEHLPAKLFLNREWYARGEIPLWNPHHFCGSPFVHDIQVGAFYPPNAVIYLVPESAVGAAISWVIALHILAAGVFAYAYAQSQKLNEVGALVAAVGFMVSSKWMTHLLLAGHTVTIGLAWLPLVLLCVERGVERLSVGAILCAGAALALLGLGTHPQWAFYGGVFALAWTFPRERKGLGAWAVVWVLAAGIAGILAAVQLLPTIEAARWSARSGGLDATGTLTVGIQTLLALVGPSREYAPPLSWEAQGVFGLYWLCAACSAPLIAGGRTRWRFGVLGGLFVFSLGGAVLLESVPGFGLFRVPTRMLLVAAFPLALLAGTTVDAISRAEWEETARLALASGFRRAVLFAGVPTVLGLVFSGGGLGRDFIAYWLSVAICLPLFVCVLQRGSLSSRNRTAIWCFILLADLLAPIAVLPDVKPQSELYPSSPAMEALKSHPQPVRLLDRDLGGEDGRAAFLGIGAPQAIVHGIGTPRGYNPLDVRHYREFLAYIVNDPTPVRGNSPYTQQVIPNFEVINPELFQLLAGTHFIAPSGDPTPPGRWVRVVVDRAPPAPPPLLPRSPNPLPPHTLRAAIDPHARTWIVPRAEPLSGDRLTRLKTFDSTQAVLIETDEAISHAGTEPGHGAIAAYEPNRVTIDLDGTRGWLVLADVWFPGWTCRVDGIEVPVYRANHAFRAVPVPAGAKRAEFLFAPRSYLIGWWLSACSWGALILILLWKARRSSDRAAPANLDPERP